MSRLTDLPFLRRQIERGDIVLFAGAGFSLGATNRRGESPPLGAELAILLSERCGWDYHGDHLSDVYAQAEKHLGTSGLQSFLEEHYLNCTPAPWHQLITHFCWHRIYTTNIDDVIEAAYRKSRGDQNLRSIVCPAPVQEADPWLESLPCVHLHGSVEDPSKPLTFTIDDLAETTSTSHPWYQALVDDMSARTTLFVGTQLAELPFYHYLSLRSKKLGRVKDLRAKAFVVAPEISQVKRRNFRDRNIVPIEETAESFFETLHGQFKSGPPDRMKVFQNKYPHQVASLRRSARRPVEFLRQFDFILPDKLPGATRGKRSLFYMGAEPTWSDILLNIDAMRSSTESLIDTLQAMRQNLHYWVLTGYAGSGKTTALMRTACELARSGRSVYNFKADELLDASTLLSFCRGLPRQGAFIFIDRATPQLARLASVAAELPRDKRIVFVLADRPNSILPRLSRLDDISPDVIEMPELNKEDTELILDKLEETGFLGVLQGKPRKEQVHAFLFRARKQLLVALREATSGKGFDAILAEEFESLEGEDSKLAYTIASLAAMHGAPGVRRRHLLACLDGTDERKARVLEEALRGVVITARPGSDLLAPRHRVIGQFVAAETAPMAMKRVALERFLQEVAGDITPERIRARVPEYVAYRGLVNYDGVSALFGKDYDELSEIYEAIKPFYKDDFLFWLQYGRMELEFDRFDLAEKNLNQSLAIRPNSYHTLHHLGVLKLKRAYLLTRYPDRAVDIQSGEELLLGQIKERGATDPYPYTAYLHHKLQLTLLDPAKRRLQGLEELRRVASEAVRRHPLDKMVKATAEKVERSYLSLAVSRSSP